MPRISLSPSYIKDSILVFKQRGLKGLLFGTVAPITPIEKKIITEITRRPNNARIGNLTKIDAIHKGRGTVYLAAHPNDAKSSVVVFGSDTHIANGPDLWLYLSDSKDPKKTFGSYIDLGLIHGNKGQQIYVIEKPFTSLGDYHSAIIYCKQFDVLFSFARLK